MKQLSIKGGRAGLQGEFRFVRFDTSKIQGSGPGGEALFEDLWERGAGGELRPKHPEAVLEDRTVKNKFLKRGISRLMHIALQGHGGTYTPSDITDSPTVNCFQAFILCSDKTAGGYIGDAKVEWEESDGASNGVIPTGGTGSGPGSAPHTAGEGRRGILLSDTTGPGLKRVSISYPTTDPYREIEYVFFAQANPSGALETGEDGIDNFPIMSIGLAEGVAAGAGESASRWGVRAILGLAPTLQGVSDRSYQHEGTGLTLYTGTTVLSTDGYVESSHRDGYSGDNCFDGDSTSQGITGLVDLGDKWASLDQPGPHEVGRVWSSTRDIAGIRIVVPAGTNKDLVPEQFLIRYLDPTANGGSPRPGTDADWVTVTGEDYSGGAEATEIFDGGVYGKEYVFGTPVTCNGIKVSGITSFDSGRGAEIAELYAFEEMTAVTLSSDILRLQTDVIDGYSAYSLADRAATQDVQELADAINVAVRGYELEAVRSELGYLWIRSTVAGDNSQVDLDSVASGSSANVKLGFPTGGANDVGTTQPVTKGQNDALTIIYRLNMSGDLPQV